MSFLDKFRPPNRPGLRYSDEARHWASEHFPESHQQIAAIVVGILCEQTGASFSEIRASTHFMNDMNVYDFFDTVDFSTAVQQEFQLVIPEHDLAKMNRISDVVGYLYDRVQKPMV
jgi:acyl carrier protein